MNRRELQETVHFWRRKVDERMQQWDAKDRSRLPRNFLKELLSPTHRTVAAVDRDLPLGWIDATVWRMVDAGEITLSMARQIGRFVRQNDLANPLSSDFAFVARERGYTAHEFGGALSDLRDSLLIARDRAADPEGQPFGEMIDHLVHGHLDEIRSLHEELTERETRLAMFEGLATTPFRATEVQEALLAKDRERLDEIRKRLEGTSARSALARRG